MPLPDTATTATTRSLWDARLILLGAQTFLAAAVVLGVWITLMPGAGGYFPRDWYPASLAMVALWTTVALGRGRAVPEGRSLRIALGALAGLTAWSLLSAVWADAPGRAWESANQLLGYLAAAGTLALLPWTTRAAEVFLGTLSAATLGVCGISLVAALGTDDLGSRFIEDRWAEPLGYPNGAAALAMIGALVALVLAARRGRHPAVDAALLSVAAALAGFGLLPQSRGSVIGLAAGLLVAALVSPARWRLAIRTAIVAGAAALVLDPASVLVDAADAGAGVRAALEDASVAIGLGALLAGVAGLVVAFGERRLQVSETAARRSGLFALAAVVIGTMAVAGIQADRISDTVSEQWRKASNPGPSKTRRAQREGSRLLSADPVQRYDYWRVSLRSFRAAPLGGEGAGSFTVRYTKERRYAKHSLFPHNLLMRVLGETGVVGLLLALTLGGAVAAGLVMRMRAASPGQRTVAGAALSAAAYFGAHAQFDWIEMFPVMAGPVIGMLVIALAVRRGEIPRTRLAEQSRTKAAQRMRVVRPVAVGVVAFAALTSLALPYLAVRYRERAISVWRADPRAAYRDLDRAARVDPLSATALITEGTIAIERREYRRAERAFRDALSREPAWLAHFELGLILAERGDRKAAARQLAMARDLNPLEPAILAAQKGVSEGRRIDPPTIHRHLFEFRLFKNRRMS